LILVDANSSSRRCIGEQSGTDSQCNERIASCGG
jgi:hypothetical protein